MAEVTVSSDFRTQEEEIRYHFHLFPTIWHEVMGLDAMILVFFKIIILKPSLSCSSFTLIKRLLVPLHFQPLEWYHLHI